MASFIVYFILTLLMPFDWVFERKTDAETIALARRDEIKYPCDLEDTHATANGNILLKLSNLSAIYPDGTHAVKDMSFQVKEGEVLSFLGANGAGMSISLYLVYVER